MGEKDDIDKLLDEVNFRLAHSKITELRSPPISEEEKDKVLRSLFITRTDYEQYALRRRQQEEQEEKDAEAREAARLKRLENDPAYWKRLYLGMVEREKERQRHREMMQGMWIVAGAVGAILLVLKIIFHW